MGKCGEVVDMVKLYLGFNVECVVWVIDCLMLVVLCVFKLIECVLVVFDGSFSVCKVVEFVVCYLLFVGL